MPVRRFALDEDVSHPLAALLGSRGYDIASAKELGRLRLTDPQFLLGAIEAGQTLITHNADDFEALHEAWMLWRRRWQDEIGRTVGRSVALSGHPGILMPPHLPPETLASIIEEIGASSESIEDRLFSWTPELGWGEVVF